MATKLYPPYIEGTIPAFCTSSGTAQIVVPFSLNKAVSTVQIGGFVLKIKTVSSGTLIGTIKQTDVRYFELDNDMSVRFIVPEATRKKLIVGQYYKLQLAFVNKENNETGYYSTVGVIKYTTSPRVGIEGMDKNTGSINNHQYTYVGTYSQKNGDITEKMYSSRFVITDSNGVEVSNSGEILHNATTDIESFESFEEYIFEKELDLNKYYYIQYIVTTSNNMVVKSPRYRIMERTSIDPELKATLKATLNFEDGYIDLWLKGELDENGIEQIATGSFIISRHASNQPGVWNVIKTFTLQGQSATKWLWRDFTIEQGVTYVYAVQQFNDKIQSNRIESNEIYADFEDAFLYDGERQLKIRYNPKVSTFKVDILESKSETIGSKYPFIFRNGNVYYKEFALSGLVSYQMDDNEFFMTKADLGIDVSSANLTSENIAAERAFKLKVLEWLNNGQEKIFRTPTEGNFIVRLMNASFSPIDSVSRMLHNFSCSAYETADFNYNNMRNRNFISIGNTDKTLTRWTTIELASHSSDLDDIISSAESYFIAGMTTTFDAEKYSRVKNYYNMDSSTDKPANFLSFFEHNADQNNYLFVPVIINANGISNVRQGAEEALKYLKTIAGKVTYPTGMINTHTAYSVSMVGMLPGTIIRIDGEKIQIGATGAYSATFEKGVSEIFVPEIDEQTASSLMGFGIQGSITYSYKSTSVNIFDEVNDMNIIDVPCRQWIGKPEKEYYDTVSDKWDTTNNLIEIIEDCKKKIINFSTIKFIKRPLQNIFFVEDEKTGDIEYYYNMDCSPDRHVLLNELDPYTVYAICNPRKDYTYANIANEGYFVDANFLQGYYVDKDGQKTPVFTGRLMDGKSTMDNKIIYKSEEYFDIDEENGDIKYSVSVLINGDKIDLTEIERFTLKNFDEPIKSIYFGNGVMCEASYQLREIIYNFEFENYSTLVHSAKKIYTTHLDELNRAKKTFETSSMFTEESLQAYIDRKVVEINNDYKMFIYKLDMAIREYEEANANL